MTDSRILDRYANRGSSSGVNDNENQEEGEICDLGTFGLLRGSRERATMLELRKKDGSILAIGYGYVDKIEYEPSTGITLHLAEQRIRVKGRNLNVETIPKVKLFEVLARQKVPWIQEACDSEGLMGSESETIVESIEW